MPPKKIVPTAVVSSSPKAVNPKVAFAASMSGYDASSPIWNKQLTEVLDMIDKEVDATNAAGIKTLTQELRKRLVKGKLIKAQR